MLALVAPSRSDTSHLAGRAALHIGPTGKRFSNDIDFFHNSADAANQTFAADALALALRGAGYEVSVIAEHRGFVSATVRRAGDATVLDWAHESAWRFLPLAMASGGVMLHPIDLAINKLVALANRREPRDLVDAISASLAPTASRKLNAIFDAWSRARMHSSLPTHTVNPGRCYKIGAQVPFSFHNPTTTGLIGVRIAAPWTVSSRRPMLARSCQINSLSKNVSCDRS